MIAWQPDPRGLTVVRATGFTLAKRVIAGGSSVPVMPKFIDAAEMVIRDLHHLGHVLARLEHRPECAVMRGALVGTEPRAGNIRRLLHPDHETGDPATVRDVARQWIALDIDGAPLRDGGSPLDLVSCADAVRLALPSAFHAAAMIFQPTASHGVKPGIRGRAWFWLRRPIDGAQAKRWLGDIAWVDAALFCAAVAILTAAPVYIDVADPFPTRLVRLEGHAAVDVPDIAESTAPLPPPRPSREGVASARRYALGALDIACQRIGGAGQGARNVTLNTEAFALGKFVRSGDLTESEARTALVVAAEVAGLDAREAQVTINSALRAALARDRAA